MNLTNLNAVKRHAEESYREAFKYAITYVKSKARLLLQRDNSLNEFVMAMGIAMFIDRDGNIVDLEDIGEAFDLAAFIDHWDDYLRITGYPVRFTAYGDEIYDW